MLTRDDIKPPCSHYLFDIFQTSEAMREILVENNVTILASTTFTTDPDPQVQQLKVIL